MGAGCRRWSDRVPIVEVLRTYDRRWLRTDVAAGVAVAALIVPKNLGYAGIAGIPLQNGLYAAAAGAILYAIFGTSRQISTGPSSGLAAVAASAVLAVGLTGAQAAPFVAGITLVSGVVFLVLAVLRMGWIAQFLSRAVVTGFLFGAAIDVVVGELPKITGTSAEGSTPPQELWSWLGTLGDVNRATVVVGVVALVTVFGLRRVAPRVPGALVLVVGGLLATWLLDLGERGVALVGDVPRGLPSVEVPDVALLLDNVATVALASVALVMIGFSQTAGDARTFAARHRYRVDIDQESFAQGAANVGAGLLQGMPVSTSLSASSLNDRTGARTPVASLTSGVMVLLTLVLLAPLFSGLPTAVLAAIIIEAVVMGMMDVAALRRLARVQRFDFWIAIVALVSTVLVGVLAGVLVGIGLSLLWLVSVTTRPSLPLMVRERGTQVFRELGEHADDEPEPDIAVIRIDGGLFFATADALEDRVREVAEANPGLSAIVIDCGAITIVDAQGAATLHEILALAQDHDVTVRLARVKPSVRATLARDGVVDRLGPDKLHGSVHRAVEAHRAQQPRDATD
ncbi:SulP family inorganic anion transporter [Cellulomonas xylanilytica]|uniref:SulP family inorganic anion transporter n=1 Tax=Cellulomonas xylanilytica TaxID=233583 RepID=UPI0011BF9D0E|nr:SulP family inorganic anion transporter [Cellulomonas xylanilytica]